jgi:hypothetical protein
VNHTAEQVQDLEPGAQAHLRRPAFAGTTILALLLSGAARMGWCATLTCSPAAGPSSR